MTGLAQQSLMWLMCAGVMASDAPSHSPPVSVVCVCPSGVAWPVPVCDAASVLRAFARRTSFRRTALPFVWLGQGS